MRIRWRGLELPARVMNDQEVSTPTYGKFTAEPFERGFGTTVGNSLRRIRRGIKALSASYCVDRVWLNPFQDA